MTAADEPIRQAGYYLPVVFGVVAAWAAGKAGLLELDYEDAAALMPPRKTITNNHLFSPQIPYIQKD